MTSCEKEKKLYFFVVITCLLINDYYIMCVLRCYFNSVQFFTSLIKFGLTSYEYV